MNNYEICKVTEKYGPYMRNKALIGMVPKEVHILDLLDKGFKSAIINMFKELKKTIFKELKKSMRILHHIENISKETQIKKKKKESI